MTRHLARLTALCCALLAALSTGCSSSTEQFNDATYCGKAAAVMCENIMACCTGKQRASVLGEENVNDLAKCKHDQAVACEADQAETLWAIDQGTVVYHDDVAKTCIDALKRPDGADCSTMAEALPWKDACKDSPFEGKIGNDSECHWTVECVKGSTCVSGKCKAPPAEGETCTSVCATGLFCKAGKCAALLSSGTTCTSSYECQEGLYCDTPATGTATCKSQKTPGTACSADSECDSGDCLPGSCVSDGSSCTSDSYCDGVCAHDATTTCFSDWSCDSYCEKSGKVCTLNSDCDTATSEQCVDDTCGDGKCTGRTCGSKELITVDYCTLN